MYNCCLKGIQQAKGIPRLFAASECPQEKVFPREHCRVFPVVRLSFCEGKNLFPHWCLSEKAVFKFLFPTKNSNDPDFYLILDFSKETHSEFPARLVSFFFLAVSCPKCLDLWQFFYCVALSVTPSFAT